MKRLLLLLLFLTPNLFGADIPSLHYDKALLGLVGNGEFLVKTEPNAYTCVRGGSFSAKFSTEKACTGSEFFPGGVEYSFEDGSKVLYGATKEKGMIAVVYGCTAPKGYVKMNQAKYLACKQALYEPYTKGLLTATPDSTLDLAVQFSQQLLDLGFNGQFMLCELFRWLDIWARDLGSGLLPGALASGRSFQARKSLEYDLARYGSCSPQDCKNTNDPSQGGTAEGIGWTARSIWNYYMYSGDKQTLRSDMQTLRPWIDYWIGRDYDEDGLIIDVTEFMDHMIMMLTTEGVTTLAANAMFYSMLLYSAMIEEELGNNTKAQKYYSLSMRTINAINTRYWNSSKGYFNNLLLWGQQSERSAQASQAMLLKMGGTDPERTKQTLDYLKANNWIEYGSLTITPKMNHVPLTNDQNVKVWPWWNFWEAEARLHNGDTEGGYFLISQGAKTIKDEHYPGFIEENMDIDGSPFGGHAFPTAAGNLLEIVTKDLFGIKALTAGWEEVEVAPNVPANWKNYSCTVPVPGGFLSLDCKNGVLSINVQSTKIKRVRTPEAVTVTGATALALINKEAFIQKYTPVEKKALPSIPKGKRIQFVEQELGVKALPFINEVVDINGLCKINESDYTHLIINGNILPKCARSSIEKFIQRGGQIIFYGATTNSKNDEDGAGILGEQCGIIDWVDYLPEREKLYIDGWKVEALQYKRYSNYKYTSTFTIPELFKGKDIYLEIGPLTGLDSVFVNGKLVGTYCDVDKIRSVEYPAKTSYPANHEYMRVSRLYEIDKEEQKHLCFGGENTISISINRDVCHEGLSMNMPSISVLSGDKAWQFIDEDIAGFGFDSPKRKGVNYWGNEQFFNSWSTKQGLFGITKHGFGVEFEKGSVLGDLPFTNIETQAVYTDFAIFAPMNFEALAYTTTTQRLLYPSESERYPCIARITHNNLGGGYVLIAPALAKGVLGEQIIDKLTK